MTAWEVFVGYLVLDALIGNTDRPDDDAFVQQLGLDREADSFEVLARSEGWRSADRVEVFSEPVRDEHGRLTTLFFARGVRHIDGASEAIAGLHAGERLALEPQPTNQYNARELLAHPCGVVATTDDGVPTRSSPVPRRSARCADA